MALANLTAKFKAHLKREWTIPMWLIYAIFINLWFIGWLDRHFSKWISGAIWGVCYFTAVFIGAQLEDGYRDQPAGPA